MDIKTQRGMVNPTWSQTSLRELSTEDSIISLRTHDNTFFSWKDGLGWTPLALLLP